MKQWYPKEFSRLTQISVRTLHHYDHIGLLKPSVRQSNGYRLYSETDLLRLQQIIALKFFGFELAEIQQLLLNETGIFEHFACQAKCLEEKAEALLQASQLLKNLTDNFEPQQKIPWENIIEMIEVYRMTQKLENSWAKELFNPTELKQFMQLEASNHLNSSDKLQMFKAEWQKLVAAIQDNLGLDPKSAKGIGLGQRCMEIVNNYYGKEHANLRTKLFEQGFGEGKFLDEAGLNKKALHWLEQAVDGYWRQRIYRILAQVGQSSSAEIFTQWNELLSDMYGNEEPRKQELIQVALADEQISTEAKQWLKKMFVLR